MASSSPSISSSFLGGLVCFVSYELIIAGELLNFNLDSLRGFLTALSLRNNCKSE